MEDDPQPGDISLETPPSNIFIPPSIHNDALLSGTSYTHHTSIPPTIASDLNTECILGIDEAGRGPVLGPMVYGLFYLPLSLHRTLLADTHHFNDSKVLKPDVRSSLMRTLCSPPTSTSSSSSDLYTNCGWATRVMSARDISAGQLRPMGAKYNLNEQAMDATVQLIKDVCSRGVNVKEIYVDTVGKETTYQKKLERVFPTITVTVAKKADSIYPCVSAASVCAKVTRDAALEVMYEAYAKGARREEGHDEQPEPEGWGSGYPGDARATAWLKRNMDPLFGWGSECRFSWGTAKEMLEVMGGDGVRVDWPTLEDDTDGRMKLTEWCSGFGNGGQEVAKEEDELANWFGRPAPESVI